MKNENSPNLEATLSRLTEIVTQMERGSIDLDQALRLFEEGASKVREANQLIRKAELKVEQVIESVTGELQVESVETTRD